MRGQALPWCDCGGASSSKEKRYDNIMGQLHVGSQKPLPQKGDHYRSYQTTEEGVICTTGIITKCTGNSTHPYEVTCTRSDIRGYVGKTVTARAVELTERITKAENKPTQEEEQLPRAARTGSQKKNKKQNTPEKGICRTAFTEPSIFKHRAVFTGKRRQDERVAPGLGPGPAGGLKER